MTRENDSQALTCGDITRYRALGARISYLSQDRPDLKFASMQVCCAMAKPTARDMERVKRIGRYLAGKPRARCWFGWQQSGELEAYSDADWGGDRATRRFVSAGGHHERRTLPQGMDQETTSCVACPPPRVSCTPQSRLHQKGSGSRASQRTWEYDVG